MTVRICRWCHKDFLIENWRLKNINRGQFCSKSCAISSRNYIGGRDPLKVKAVKKAWRVRNKDYMDFKRRQWKHQLRHAEGKHTLQEWLNMKRFVEYSCVRCFKKEPEIKLTEDHILPLSLGGTNYIKNIQPLCASCNSWKKDKYIQFLPIILSGNYIGKGV